MAALALAFALSFAATLAALALARGLLLLGSTFSLAPLSKLVLLLLWKRGIFFLIMAAKMNARLWADAGAVANIIAGDPTSGITNLGDPTFAGGTALGNRIKLQHVSDSSIKISTQSRG